MCMSKIGQSYDRFHRYISVLQYLLISVSIGSIIARSMTLCDQFYYYYIYIYIYKLS